MTFAQPSVVAADEDIRLTSCALEPIHLPGAIQPHGALLVVDPESLEIIQVSENTADVLGVDAPLLLGTALGDLIGAEVQAQLQRKLAAGIGSGSNPLSAHVRGRDFDLIVRRSGD